MALNALVDLFFVPIRNSVGLKGLTADLKEEMIMSELTENENSKCPAISD